MQVAHLSDILRAQVGNCSGSCAKAVFIDQGDNYTGDGEYKRRSKSVPGGGGLKVYHCS